MRPEPVNPTPAVPPPSRTPAPPLPSSKEAGRGFDPTNPRHEAALHEQAQALERIIPRKLAALVGRAGTGKTSVLGALLRCDPISKGGVLLLAPTGKARVRLGNVTGADAMTIANFLNS